MPRAKIQTSPNCVHFNNLLSLSHRFTFTHKIAFYSPSVDRDLWYGIYFCVVTPIENVNSITILITYFIYRFVDVLFSLLLCKRQRTHESSNNNTMQSSRLWINDVFICLIVEWQKDSRLNAFQMCRSSRYSNKTDKHIYYPLSDDMCGHNSI